MMRLALALLLILVTAVGTSYPVLAQPEPEFKLGFRVLAEMIPTVVGQPLENEHHDPQSGDALQRTTRGLLVWRKSDNVTAFTDGTTTWLNGPFGLQSRPNGARFGWERGDSLPSLPDSAVSLTFSDTQDGAWVGRGSVRNTLAETVDVEVNAIGFSASALPLVDAPTLFVLGVPPGESRSIAVRVPFTGDVGSWTWSVHSHPSSERGESAIDVGTTRKLDVDPALAGTVDALRRVDGGEWLVRVAAEQGVQVIRHPTPASVLGTFQPDENVVGISSLLDGSSAWVRAAVLAHELQHVADAAAGNLPRTTVQCFRFEAAAFERQAVVWAELWRSNLPPDLDALHAELNDVTITVAQDPEAFVAELVQRYRAECQAIP